MYTLRVGESEATSVPQPVLWDKIDDLIGKLIHQRHAQKKAAATAAFSPADQSLHERVLQIVWVSYILWLKSLFFHSRESREPWGQRFILLNRKFKRLTCLESGFSAVMSESMDL